MIRSTRSHYILFHKSGNVSLTVYSKPFSLLNGTINWFDIATKQTIYSLLDCLKAIWMREKKLEKNISLSWNWKLNQKYIAYISVRQEFLLKAWEATRIYVYWAFSIPMSSNGKSSKFSMKQKTENSKETFSTNIIVCHRCN